MVTRTRWMSFIRTGSADNMHMLVAMLLLILSFAVA